MNATQRTHSDNGIWLCVACSIKIDKNDGIDYPTTLLQQWRDTREREAFQKLGKPESLSVSTISGAIEAHGIGEVTGLELTKPTKIDPGTSVSVSGWGKITGVRN